jgi:hypothetical protein
MLYTQCSLQNESFTDEKHDILVSLHFKCIMEKNCNMLFICKKKWTC